MVPELASRLSGSSDIYAPSGRRTYASVNFVTCHDGFTLTDLVTYEHKHNEANGEDNRDGATRTTARNWGVEGPTDAVRIQRARDRMKRNLLATLFFSQGVPHAARWRRDRPDPARQQQRLLPGQRDQLVRLGHRRDRAGTCTTSSATSSPSCSRNPILRRRAFFTGEPPPGLHTKDVTWIRPDGPEMTDEDWSDPTNGASGCSCSGQAADEVDVRGRSAIGRHPCFCC